MTYEEIKRKFTRGTWSAPMVRMAVRKGLISKAQYTEITGIAY